jgi:hypothetical protein
MRHSIVRRFHKAKFRLFIAATSLTEQRVEGVVVVVALAQALHSAALEAPVEATVERVVVP